MSEEIADPHPIPVADGVRTETLRSEAGRQTVALRWHAGQLEEIDGAKREAGIAGCSAEAGSSTLGEFAGLPRCGPGSFLVASRGGELKASGPDS